MKFLLPAVACLVTLSSLTAGSLPWAGTLKPEKPGSFPPVPPFTGEFSFGWSNIEAASAKAAFKPSGTGYIVDVQGGSTGLARTMWTLDATHRSVLSNGGLTPVAFSQTETYWNRVVTTKAEFRPDALWRLRVVKMNDAPAPEEKWKRVNIAPINDIVSAMLFIRSQPLKTGDKVRLIVFPGDSAFLTDVTVVSHESLRIAGKTLPAIKLDFRPQKIIRADGGGSYRLEAYSKFSKGSVWISDDKYRIPLRAEVSIFVGYVYGELKNATFSDGTVLP